MFKESIRIQRLLRRSSKSKWMNCNLWCCTHCKLDKLLFQFAISYQIWGATLHDYKPFGFLICNSHKNIQRRNIQKRVSVKKILETCSNKFIVNRKWSLRRSYSVYNASERVMATVMIVLVLCYVIGPTVFHIYQINSLKLLNIAFISGIIANMVASYAVYMYTEVIFYRLFEYHAYMETLAGLLHIHPIEMRDIDMNLIAEKKQVVKLTIDDQKHDAVDNLSSLLLPLQLNPNDPESDEERKYKPIEPRTKHLLPIFRENKAIVARRRSQRKIYLFEGRNAYIWFENWSRIENLASLYFNNRKSYIFAVVLCVGFGIGFAIYSISYLDNWLNANVIAIYFGLCYFIVAFIRLLLASFRFSKLENRYIGLIQNQHTYALYRGIENSKTMDFMNDIIKQIKYRSVSPTIAGVSMDVALVRLSISTFLGLITTGITYALKSM